MTASDRSTRRVGHLVVALCVALAFIAGACSSGSDSEGSSGSIVDEGEPTPGGILQVALPNEIDGMDPTTNRWSLEGNLIASSVFDPLMTFDADRKLVPMLAESVTPNDDGTVFTIALRDDVTFSDGTPFDADAVKLNIDKRREDPITGGALLPIDDVVVIDPLTVEVQMNTPWFSYPYTLAAQGGYMAAPSQLESDDERTTLAIGTGPFTQTSPFTPGQPIDVTRNESYWQDPAYLDGVEFTAIVDDTSRVASLKTGDTDVTMTADANAIVELQADPTIKIVLDAGNEEAILMFNLAAAPFDNIHARRAVAAAVDVQQIIDAIGAGIQEAANQPFTPDEEYYVEDSKYPGYDPELAQTELAAYTADTGESSLSFTLSIPASPVVQQTAELVQAQLEAAGITMTIDPKDQSTFLTDMFFSDFQMAYFRNFSYVNPDSNYIFWHSSNANGVGKGSINFGQLVSDDLDAALDAARATPEESERLVEYNKVTQAINESVGYVWLTHAVWAIAARDDVGGLSAAGDLGFARQDAKPWWPDIWLAQ